jgi:hypothetical protein
MFHRAYSATLPDCLLLTTPVGPIGTDSQRNECPLGPGAARRGCTEAAMSEPRLVGPTAGVGKWQGYRFGKTFGSGYNATPQQNGIQATVGGFVPRASAALMCGTCSKFLQGSACRIPRRRATSASGARVCRVHSFEGNPSISRSFCESRCLGRTQQSEEVGAPKPAC